MRLRRPKALQEPPRKLQEPPRSQERLRAAKTSPGECPGKPKKAQERPGRPREAQTNPRKPKEAQTPRQAQGSPKEAAGSHKEVPSGRPRSPPGWYSSWGLPKRCATTSPRNHYASKLPRFESQGAGGMGAKPSRYKGEEEVGSAGIFSVQPPQSRAV